jgi:ketosteroid isomerase-like protein
MTDDHVPAAIREFVEATNDGDTDRFVAAFTDDAYLNDWGREFHGHSGVRSWDGTDNIGKQSHFEVLGVESGDAPESYVVTMKVTGNGFNGTSPLAFTLRGDRIAALRIS